MAQQTTENHGRLQQTQASMDRVTLSSPGPARSPRLSYLDVIIQQLSCWLSPVTWRGMAKFRQVTLEDADHEMMWFDTTSWQIFRGSILAVSLGMILADGQRQAATAATGSKRMLTTSRTNLYIWSSLLVVFMVLTNKHVLQRLQNYTRYIYRLCGVMQSTLKLHSATTDDGKEAMARALADGRAHRTRHYTLYWPPTHAAPDPAVGNSKDADNTNNSNYQKPPTKLLMILLLPGLGVSDVAYAPPSLRLLEGAQRQRRGRGDLSVVAAVAVVATDPLRVPSPLVGYTADYLRRSIMAPVERATMQQWRRQRQQQSAASEPAAAVAATKDTLIEDEPPLNPSIEWVLVGHSLGSLTAASVARELNLRKVVLWGPAPYLTHVPNLVAETSINDSTSRDKASKSKSSASSPLRLLVVQGSRDGLVRDLLKSMPDAMDQFWKRFPEDSTHRVVLEGGTHAGFAGYTPVYQEHGQDEKEAAVELLSPDVQQNLAVQSTLDFLQS